MATEKELEQARRARVLKLQAAGTQAYPQFSFDDIESARRSCLEAASIAKNPELRATMPTEATLGQDNSTQGAHREFTIYGRVVAKRGPFLVIRTSAGDVQALIRADALPAEQALQYKAVDLADHVVVEGPMLQTRTGDVAIHARSYRHAGKTLLPPPEKWKGLSDIEKRYRERYVDLFANPEVADVFRARGLIVSSLRSFLDARGFLEVETPLLHPLRGGATAHPFTTHHRALDLSLYLRIAPELYLKRLLVGGLDRVYEIGRAFRNEGISTRHNPEFTILELYMAFARCQDLIVLTEAMFQHVDEAIRTQFAHRSDWVEKRSFSLTSTWKKVQQRQSILDAAKFFADASNSLPPDEVTPAHQALSAGMNEEVLRKPEALAALCQTLVPLLPKSNRDYLKRVRTYGEQVFALFEIFVEPILSSLYRNNENTHSVPVFITEYPADVSPLARRQDEDPVFTDRFELFIEGREVANAFTELNDPDDQADRFRDQLERQKSGDEEAMDFDADYVRALQHGMPPAAGFGMGVDRLTMLFCGQESIRDVLLFPLLRPETKVSDE